MYKRQDVVVAPTAQSLTHTNARIEAAKAGTRVATMPGITEEMFSKGDVYKRQLQELEFACKVRRYIQNKTTNFKDKRGMNHTI